MTQPRKLNHDDYIIGWICPLEVEQTAALLMLDELHERLPQNLVDHNVYNLGSINGHNVVIAGLPTTGNNPAATVVTQMKNTFKSLRFCLLVGIGGGVPTETDDGPIRLGDVVVSKPAGVNSGAVQYDRGKAEAGSFKRTGFLQPPPSVLLNAAQDLAVKRAIEDEDPLPKHLLRFDPKKRGLRRYRFPGRQNDHLYAPDYDHADPSSSCENCGCDANHQISRTHDDESDDDDEDGSYIIIHRGTIASGELVMKNGAHRDALAKELGILCFEMEAAGAMNDFPCLVIRGISDYSDSHKNIKWHGYAAAVAAAYARQLFFHMPVDEVKKCSVAIEEITRIKDDIGSLQQHAHDSQHQAILDWLSPVNHAMQHNDLARRRQSGTGEWLLNSNEFKNWLNGSQQTLFCPGMPGAGKTMIASIVIDHLHASHHDDANVGIAYVYCNFRRGEEQKPEDLLAGILKQLLLFRMPSFVQESLELHKRRYTRPSIDDLSQAIQTVATCYTRTFVLVDALDELDSGRTRFISTIFDLQRQTTANIFATSRYIPEIEKAFKGCNMLEIRASKEDVRRYLESQMSRLPDLVASSSELQEEVANAIVKAVDGMFLLAQLHMSSLEGKLTRKTLRTALRSLPSGSTAYDEAYKVAIERVTGQVDGRRDLAIQTLSWITCAKRPLTTLELQHALAVEPDTVELDEDNLPETHDMVSSCAGLVTVDEASQIIRLVHYTTQEYFERNRDSTFPDCHTKIGYNCVVYLSFDRFNAGYCSSDEEFKDRLRENPLYDYAAQYWGCHVKEGSPENDNAVLELLKDDHKVAACSQAVARSRFWLDRSQIRVMRGGHLAADLGLYRTMAQLLDDGLDTEVRDSSDCTPLIYAARSGHAQIVDLMIKRGADVDNTGNRSSALREAASQGHSQIVRMLIDAGADVNAKIEERGSVLCIASGEDHCQIVEMLLDYGALVNAVHCRESPLVAASRRGHGRTVQLLLDRGAEVDDGSNYSGGPLLAACVGGHEEIVQILLARGANVNGSYDRPSPLLAACKRGHKEIVQILFDSGAEVSKASEHGGSPLHAAYRGGHEEIARMLLDRGATNFRYRRRNAIWGFRQPRTDCQAATRYRFRFR